MDGAGKNISCCYAEILKSQIRIVGISVGPTTVLVSISATGEIEETRELITDWCIDYGRLGYDIQSYQGGDGLDIVVMERSKGPLLFEKMDYFLLEEGQLL